MAVVVDKNENFEIMSEDKRIDNIIFTYQRSELPEEIK